MPRGGATWDGDVRRHAWADLQFIVVAAIGGLAFLLGFVGYRGAESNISDALLQSVQLFVLEGGLPPGGVPWQLELARFVAPAVLAYAGIRAVLSVAREEVLRWRAQLFARRHSIVVGLTDTAFSVAKALADAGRTVVVIDDTPSSPRAAACHQRGISVIFGDLADIAVITRARPARATDVVIATGSDATNLRALATCGRAVSGDRSLPALHVEIACGRLWSELDAVDPTGPDQPRVQFFSAAEIEAQAMLDVIGADLARAHRLVLCGAGAVPTRLAVHAATQARAAGRTLDVELVGAGSEELRGQVLAFAPWLAEEGILTATAKLREDGSGPAIGVVCGLDDAAALATAADLAEEMNGAGSPVFASVSDSTLAPQLRGTRLDRTRIRLVPAGGVALGPMVLAQRSPERSRTSAKSTPSPSRSSAARNGR